MSDLYLFEDAKKLNKHEDYEAFTAKFKPKLTTDDCMTPEPIYEAVANWVAHAYDLSRDNFVRPFWPGADFTAFNYQPEHVVVDNPPFSIGAKIVRWYLEHEIKFFLFAPALTLFNTTSTSCCAIACGVHITYDNGARVPTSFVTNLEEAGVTVYPEPYHTIKVIDDWNVRQGKQPELPKYKYPAHVLTAARLNQLSKYGVPFRASSDEIYKVGSLDAMKGLKTKSGKSKTTIFGDGFLLSDAKAAELRAAELKLAEQRDVIEWTLSERELAIIERLGNGAADG